MKPLLIGILLGLLIGGGWGYIIGDSRPSTVIEEKTINHYYIEVASFFERWCLNAEDVE